MRLLRNAAGIALVVLTLHASLQAAGPKPVSVWRTDYAQAMAEAKRLNRPVVIHFGARWCPPCQRMERETLNTPELLQMLSSGFIALKLDADAHGEAKRHFEVENLPTDLLVSPEGKVLVRKVGYQSKQDYLASVGRISARYPASKEQLAQSRPAATPAKPVNRTPAAENQPEIAARTPSALPATQGDKLPPDPIDHPDLAAAEPEPAEATQTNAEQVGPLLALDGYCPVTLRTTRTWKSGQKDISVEHKGQIFYFATAKQAQDFKSNPSRFAPRLLGCDAVILSESNLAIQGSTQYGAFYDGELYLFESAESRSKFRSNPARYSRTKHVLNPDDIKKRRA